MTETRGERKERTRRAILDAALQLCEDSSLVALSLRQVAKEVGIVPTAFYRHFDSIEALGLELVDESFASLRAMLLDVRRSDPDFDDIIDSSIGILVEHVHQQRAHFRFIVRERAAGPPRVREAINAAIEQFEKELATDLVRLTGTTTWSPEDLQILSGLIVTAMVGLAEAILRNPDRPDAEKAIVEGARVQLRMVLVGALNWRSKR
ncbi:TetR family transcriptional regulator [Nocardioides psychrotolerans]|uniref:TetR family transcriptional regulator n=1 Tax=Nocardioides psychrotolerans TaxID=1005945 RepID=UPI000AEB719F|nr:TetR family transcriptional regulator [Nocardioides psychrotolerans]GEP37945.1 TetR family transcriptional regulator [Nocardioides psychrotolerans]